MTLPPKKAHPASTNSLRQAISAENILSVTDAHDSGYVRNPHTHEAWYGCSCGERAEVYGYKQVARWQREHVAEKLNEMLESLLYDAPEEQ